MQMRLQMSKVQFQRFRMYQKFVRRKEGPRIAVVLILIRPAAEKAGKPDSERVEAMSRD